MKPYPSKVVRKTEVVEHSEDVQMEKIESRHCHVTAQQDLKGEEKYYNYAKKRGGLEPEDGLLHEKLTKEREQAEQREASRWRKENLHEGSRDVHWRIKITYNKESTHPISLDTTKESVLIAHVITGNKTDSRIKYLQTFITGENGEVISSVFTRERFMGMFERMLQELDSLIRNKFPRKRLKRVWMCKSTMMTWWQCRCNAGLLYVDPIRDIKFTLKEAPIISNSVYELKDNQVYERLWGAQRR